jgi:hypothetical protein
MDDHSNFTLGVITHEEGIALAKAAGRCPQCIVYGVRPPLFCLYCGTGETPFNPATAGSQNPAG